MGFDNLRDFLRAIEARGQLLRVKEKVSPILEITEWADRTVKQQGPALLFENVDGSAMPVAINLFGTRERTALALGVSDVNGALRSHFRDRHPIPPDTPASLADEALAVLQQL